jgi:hypothetical protein
MKKNTKILLALGVGFALYLYFKPKKKKATPTQKTNDNVDTTRSSYNIVPLPDIKNYKFGVTTPIQTIGATSSSPIIIGTPITK